MGALEITAKLTRIFFKSSTENGLVGFKFYLKRLTKKCLRIMSALGRRPSRAQHHAKSYAEVMKDGGVAATVRRKEAVAMAAAPRRPAQHPGFTVVVIPIFTPFPYVAAHVA